MRAIPLVTARALDEATSDDAMLILVTIRHPAIDAPIRLVNDGVDYSIAGATYWRSAFTLSLLSDDDSPPTSRFAFPSIDRAALTRLAGVADPARIDFEVWSAASFDRSLDPRPAKPGEAAVYAARELFFTDVSVDAARCEGSLRSWDYRQEAWPNLRATSALAPGAWL